MKIRFKRKPKFNFRVFINWLVIILVLAAIGTYAYLQKTGKIERLSTKIEPSQEASIGETPAISSDNGMESIDQNHASQIPIELNPQGEVNQQEISLSPSQGKVYKEVAEYGEGITHLARKALQEYLNEHSNINLTPEHKIYIEDYIQNHIGERWLSLGEEIEISENLIVEAINKSQQLSPKQLENLKQYSALVSF